MIWLVSETETTNPKMLEFIKTGIIIHAVFMKDWHGYLLAFAIYLIIAIAFAILFKHKHNGGSCCCRKSSLIIL
jgi:NHS family xanthosine MFS transporter